MLQLFALPVLSLSLSFSLFSLPYSLMCLAYFLLCSLSEGPDWAGCRATYVTTFLDSLVNWDFASANFAKAKK